MLHRGTAFVLIGIVLSK